MSCHGQIATFVSKRRDGRDAARIPAANFPPRPCQSQQCLDSAWGCRELRGGTPGGNVGCEVAVGEPLVEFKDVTIEFPGIRFLGSDLSRWNCSDGVNHGGSIMIHGGKTGYDQMPAAFG